MVCQAPAKILTFVDADLLRMKKVIDQTNKVYEDRQARQLKGMFDKM